MNQKRRMMWASLVLGVLALAPSQAHADELDDLLDLGDDTEQTEGGAEQPTEGDSPAAEGGESGQEAAAEKSDAAPKQPAQAKGVINPRDETIFAIQKKGRYLGRRFEVVPMGVATINNKFTSHAGGLLNGLYHFAETMSVELSLGTATTAPACSRAQNGCRPCKPSASRDWAGARLWASSIPPA